MSSSYLNSLIDDNYGPSGSSKFNLTVNYTGKRDVLKNVEASYSVGQVIDLIKSDILNNDSADIELMGLGDLNAKLSKYGFPKSNSRANYVSVSFKANGGSNDNNDDCKLANNRVRKLDLNKFPNLKKSSKPDSIFGTSNVDCAAMPCGCSMAPQTMYDLIKSVFAKNRSLFQIFCPFHKSTEWDWDYCTEVADMTDDEYFKWSKDRDKRKLKDYKECPNCKALCKRKKGVVIFRMNCDNCHSTDWCWECEQKWKASGLVLCGNASCDLVQLVNETLANAPLIKPSCFKSSVSSIRACPRCLTMMTHLPGCKHMTCKGCGKDFCFSCLGLKDSSGDWPCKSYSFECPIKPPQKFS